MDSVSIITHVLLWLMDHKDSCSTIQVKVAATKMMVPMRPKLKAEPMRVKVTVSRKKCLA